MSTRGADFLYHWISEHLPEKAPPDLLVSVADLADEAMQEAGRQGISTEEVDEEVESVYEAIFHAMEYRAGGLVD
ncbi:MULTISPECIES: DUF768 domain-containing protein [Mesorhizobium]|jgi:hypothetical protein|uniref:Uncharacterized protein DUF768 n=1 Tax=Rhizobium loti TaxID=381 RepID=A0A8E2W7L5_RHILI|nr:MULTISPECIES: DUF768 domain-containing protein [Mesorhizobium]AZO41429.1 DUF768 domain-containing protein [Mesorhizobium sp. M7D.F.Ca.US.005.01.1.1]PWJ88011.1 uncharacterized protein DUF768 [Mesorhizobium loti]RUX91318.1 DUF768 domain-containing protein [Mesorhizobium sp. M7D.F.Ca.US.004.01.2.1]RVA21436.1 DUF768 domain-containing protein [Mesorhizobium sp. M7D.F.Ca.US.004.03.1.1]